jgi:preprotein translocase subunit SecD
MSRFTWRVVGALLLTALCAFLTLANLVPEATRVASPLLPDKGLRLGLDLQGGIHWVLGVKLEEAEAQELGFLADNLRERGKEGRHVPGGFVGARERQAVARRPKPIAMACANGRPTRGSRS